MKQPEGDVAQKECTKVCRVKKSLYGLKQAVRAWFGRFVPVIHEFGLCRAEKDHYVFWERGSLLIIYVDAIVITGDDTNGIDNLKKYLQKHF